MYRLKSCSSVKDLFPNVFFKVYMEVLVLPGFTHLFEKSKMGSKLAKNVFFDVFKMIRNRSLSRSQHFLYALYAEQPQIY